MDGVWIDPVMAQVMIVLVFLSTLTLQKVGNTKRETDDLSSSDSAKALDAVSQVARANVSNSSLNLRASIMAAYACATLARQNPTAGLWGFEKW
jgi:hypothetical protein